MKILYKSKFMNNSFLIANVKIFIALGFIQIT